MIQLEKIIENLKARDQVDAVFLTGSYGSDNKPYSDVDLVIILEDNAEKINSLYTWIDNKFADIFFFDQSDLNRIETAKELSANNMDAIFIAWLEKSNISFDKSGKLTAIKDKIKDLNKKLAIPKSEKDSFAQRINYNFVANKRYFESNDHLYHEALEFRLLYSVSELISGYFEFRDLPWRGEKSAVKYLKENDTAFYQSFVGYTKADNISDKFKLYALLFKLVFANGYKQWAVGDILPQSKDRTISDESKLKKYWEGLIS
jgi:predicted nucleotidyltransferase